MLGGRTTIVEVGAWGYIFEGHVAATREAQKSALAPDISTNHCSKRIDSARRYPHLDN